MILILNLLKCRPVATETPSKLWFFKRLEKCFKSPAPPLITIGQLIFSLSKIFNRSRLYFLSEMESMLAHLTLSEISDIDTLELHIHDNLVFLSHDDIKDMIELLEENSSKYQKLKTKEERAEFLLRLYDNFPSVELRKWIQAEIDNACIKVANPEWCKHCNKWYTRERTMIVEGLTIDKPIKRFIQDPESKLVDLEKFLLNKGFLNMKMYGYILIMQGITTLEKVNEVIDD